MPRLCLCVVLLGSLLGSLAFELFAPLPRTLSAAPQATVITATQSAYTDQGAPDTNNSGLPLQLGLYESKQVLYRQFVYIQFDVSGIPDGSEVKSAKLRLYQQSASGPESYWVTPWRAPAAWSEGEITWNNQPWPDYPVGEIAGIPIAGGWVEWDVTPIVAEWIEKDAPANGIALAGDTTTLANHVFDSKSGKTPPQLVIDHLAPPTLTPTLTPTPTSTPEPAAGFALGLEPGAVSINLDPLVLGQTDTASATTTVHVTVTEGMPGTVQLELVKPPAWLNHTFTPAGGKPSFDSNLAFSITAAALPPAGNYQVTVRGSSLAASANATLSIEIRRSVYGDLVVGAAEAVQVVEARSLGQPLVQGKATAFKAPVSSTFNQTVSVYFRLVLPPGEWSAPLAVLPVNASGAAAKVAAPADLYPEIWGPYQIAPGENTIYLPYVAPGQELAPVDLVNNVPGIIGGLCRGSEFSGCTIDTRHAPRPAANTVHFTVQADPNNRIVETNEANNSYSEPGWPAIATRPWRFIFIPNGAQPTDAAATMRETRTAAKHLMEYLVGVFPIADTKVCYSVSPGYLPQAPGEERGHYLNRLLALARSENYDYAVGSTGGACGGGGTIRGFYAATIGIGCAASSPSVLAHEFDHSTTDYGDTYSLDELFAWDEHYCEYTDSVGQTQRRYCGWSNTDKPAGTIGKYCTQPVRTSPPVCTRTFAKQWLVNCHCSRDYAQDPRWPCSENPQIWTTTAQCADSCQLQCDALHGVMHPPAGSQADGRVAHPAAPGFWVNRWQPISDRFDSFMDASTPGPFPGYWMWMLPRISHITGENMRDGWIQLLSIPVFRRATDPAALLVTGWASASGEGGFEPFLQLPEALLDLEPGGSGEYEVRLVGEQGATLASLPFELSFYQTDPYGGPVDRAYFAHRVAWIDGTRAVQLWLKDKLLAERIVSPKAPAVNLLSPAGGSYSSPVTIAWTASDTDGDALTAAISVSADDGQTWNPVATGIAGNSFSLSARPLSGGSLRVKLRVTDGVNTTETVSPPFAISGGLYLPLLTR